MGKQNSYIVDTRCKIPKNTGAKKIMQTRQCWKILLGDLTVMSVLMPKMDKQVG